MKTFDYLLMEVNIWLDLTKLYFDTWDQRKHRRKSREPKTGFLCAVRQAQVIIKVCLYEFDQ